MAHIYGKTPKYIAMYPSFDAAQDAAFKRMDRFNEMGGNHIMFENSISPIFYYGDPQFEDRILAHGTDWHLTLRTVLSLSTVTMTS